MYTARDMKHDYTVLVNAWEIVSEDSPNFIILGTPEQVQKIVAALNEYDQPKDCDYCGVPIKREDIVTGAYGGTFCCDQHRQAYDKE